jgi:hypothetical protein
LKPTSSCPAFEEDASCDGHCDHYLEDYECGVWFFDLNATVGCVNLMREGPIYSSITKAQMRLSGSSA